MSESRRFGRLYVRVELAEVLSNPFGRPSGWMILAGVAVVALLLLPLFTQLVTVMVLAALAAVAIAVSYTVAAWALAAWWLESRAYARASHHWLISTSEGECGAYVRLASGGQLMLYSVCASPRGLGLGSQLMVRICSQADRAGEMLSLVAVNRRVARFYERFGFTRQRRVLTGHRMTRNVDSNIHTV